MEQKVKLLYEKLVDLNSVQIMKLFSVVDMFVGSTHVFGYPHVGSFLEFKMSHHLQKLPSS